MAKPRRLRNARGEHYAQLTVEVMESPAYVALPHYARSVLLLLTSKYRGNNNGDLSITKRDATRNGIGNWEWASGLELLQAVGLIAKTRQGKVLEGDGVCTLYRLTFRDLAPSDKYDNPIIMSRPPSHEWAQWERPSNWQSVKRTSRHKAQGKPLQSQREETALRIARLRGDEKFPACTGEPSQSTRVDGVADARAQAGGP
jgi:hypothetical protein